MTSKKRVLIADDDAALVTALAFRCKQLGQHVQSATNAISALAMIHENPPDLILMDVNMPGGNGLAACEMLASDGRLAPIPVIMLTGRSDDDTIRRCEELGAHYFLKGADAWPRLKSLVCELLDIRSAVSDEVERAAPAMPPAVRSEPAGAKVLVIDEDPMVSSVLKMRLRGYGVEVLRASNGMQGYWRALKERPAVILTGLALASYRTPQSYANSVLGRLKHHPLTKDIPVIVLADRCEGSDRDSTTGREMRTLGAAKCLTKPIDFEALVAALRIHIDLPTRAAAPALAAAGVGAAEGGDR